jgi:sec-independent protein translocase protein TatA
MWTAREAAKKRNWDMSNNPAIVYYGFIHPWRDFGSAPSIQLAAVTGGAMFGLGIGELLTIVVIAIVLFNRRLPDFGENLGKSVKKFRKAMNEPDELDVTPKNDSHEP